MIFSYYIFIFKIAKVWGAWLAQVVKCLALDLQGCDFQPHVGHKVYLKTNKLTNTYFKSGCDHPGHECHMRRELWKPGSKTYRTPILRVGVCSINDKYHQVHKCFLHGMWKDMVGIHYYMDYYMDQNNLVS